MSTASAYPATAAARDRFVEERRGPRPQRDAWRHQGVVIEREPDHEEGSVSAATVFLTGRECPWRCLMCDLWQYTVDGDTPRGALPAQLTAALAEMAQLSARTASQPSLLKLYNASSFFDPRAVPDADVPALAAAVASFRRVVVESHPRLVDRRLSQFVAACREAARPAPGPVIEVAMGLETAHPEALASLNKRVTLEQFADAAARVGAAGASLRVFVLVGVPFVPPSEQMRWTQASIAFAARCGARLVSLIPTRPGNGALEALAADGAFTPLSLADLEQALASALQTRSPSGETPSALVIADTWDLDRLAGCEACRSARLSRIAQMNLTQRAAPAVACDHCASPGAAA